MKFKGLQSGIGTKFKRWQSGSFTVETALIMPVVITVILIMFFFVLYMYNRGVMQNAVCRGAKAVFYYENESNEDIQKECSRLVFGDLEKSLVGVKDTKIEVGVSANQIEITLTGRLNVPEMLAPKDSRMEELWDYKISWEESRIHAASIIRNGQQIENVIEETKSEEDRDGS